MQGITLPVEEAVDGDQSHSAFPCRLTAHAEQLSINQRELTANLERGTGKLGHIPMSAQKEVVRSPDPCLGLCSVKEVHVHLSP